MCWVVYSLHFSTISNQQGFLTLLNSCLMVWSVSYQTWTTWNASPPLLHLKEKDVTVFSAIRVFVGTNVLLAGHAIHLAAPTHIV